MYRHNFGVAFGRIETNNNIFNDENVMSSPLRVWLKKCTNILLREYNSLEESEKNLENVFLECAKEGVNIWEVKALIYQDVPETFAYGDLFIAVWNRIKKSENKENLINILNENLNDSEDVCSTGVRERLIQTLSSSFNDMEFKISEKEYVSNLLNLTKTKYETSRSMLYPEYYAKSVSILDRFNVKGDDRDAWKETFENVGKTKIELEVSKLFLSYKEEIISYNDAYETLVKIGHNNGISERKEFKQSFYALSSLRKNKIADNVYAILKPYKEVIMYSSGIVVAYFIIKGLKL